MYIGINIFRRINYTLKYMLTSKLIIKKKILKLETKQLIFISRNLYVMVIKLYQN